MTRVSRMETHDAIAFVSWLDEDYNETDEVEDRFNSDFLVCDSYTGRSWVAARLCQESIAVYAAGDIPAMGFTTAEYQEMLRYSVENPGDFVRSEEQLNEVHALRFRRPR